VIFQALKQDEYDSIGPLSQKHPYGGNLLKTNSFPKGLVRCQDSFIRDRKQFYTILNFCQEFFWAKLVSVGEAKIHKKGKALIKNQLPFADYQLQ
jgi:hypothetical protein